MAASLLLNLMEIDPENYYKAEDLRRIATEKLGGHINDSYSDMPADRNLETIKISYRDMNRALKELERDIGLAHPDNKEQLKDILRDQSIRFSGSPSIYKLPPRVSILKRVLLNPQLLTLTMGCLRHCIDDLAFVVEASFYLQKDDKLDKKNMKLLCSALTRCRLLSNISEADIQGEYQKLFSSSSDGEVELKRSATGIAQNIFQFPELCYFVLISFLLEET